MEKARYPQELRLFAEHRMMIARATAIQAYAVLEQSQCMLFAAISGTPNEVAATIFYRLSNAYSRLAILDRLIRMKHGNIYNLFFNSVIAAARTLSAKRNEIVHWHMMFEISDGSEGGVALCFQLTPPNFWVHDVDTPTIPAEAMMEFEAQCDFFSRAINMLTMHIGTHPLGDAWPDIFAQPLQYPPQVSHPLYRQPEARPVLPEP